MARTRHRLEVNADEWSCPLCTLLNVGSDDRCAACDNARPAGQQHSGIKSEAAATAPSAAVKYSQRHFPGVFFTSRPQNEAVAGSTDASTWRHEPRLVVNRRRSAWKRGAARNEGKTTIKDVNSGNNATNEEVTRDSGDNMKVGSIERDDGATGITDEPPTTLEQEKQDAIEEEDEAEDVEEPCFNLLGAGGSIFGAPPAEEVEDNAMDEQDCQEEEEEGIEADPSPRFMGFVPASKVLVEEAAIEEKLASAGLDLSDTEDEEDKSPRSLRRHKEEIAAEDEDKWVCRICTNLNEQTEKECSSCKCSRYRKSDIKPSDAEKTVNSNLMWACHICTNLNSPDLNDCEACLSSRKPNGLPSVSFTDGRWSCSACTTFNSPDSTQCEICMSKKDDGAEKTRECPVCTEINPLGSTHCQLCDSPLQPGSTDGFIDLAISPRRPSPASSPSRRSSRYPADEVDERFIAFDNPYDDLSQFEYGIPDEPEEPDDRVDVATHVHSNFVEEISDNEPTMSPRNSRPRIQRADLKEFKHFVCMEDLRKDYRCQINYSRMFAGQRSGKSYADRLATRTAESKKRKRNAARKEAGEKGTQPPQHKGKRARAATKKRKTAASTRRASEASKPAKAKRGKKKASPARRASTATPSINHYDTGGDLGEDISTMAWEGVGSAGYF